MFWKPIKPMLSVLILLADNTNSNFVSFSRGQNKVIVHFGQVVKYFELIFIYDMLSPKEKIN